ncbi:MAG: translation elongation factor Ts [Rhabdochlamydiaceae bacterium]|nr:translation elongation factor Ts [Rhabdochlamydiaceae bacterium]
MSGKVTPEMVKQLRERTGVGMGKCKEALDQAGGNIDDAIDILRKAGMASAVKKEGRETNEGLIAAAEGKDALALVEVNAETDFVTQNEKFKLFMADVALEAAETKPATLEAFMQQPYRKDPSMTIDQYRALVIQSLGENIQVRRFLVIPKSQELSVGTYSHMGGKILSAVVLTGGSGNEALARDIAMHVAAESPDYLRPDDVPQEVRDKEAEIARGQVQGKPENIVDKIVEGKIKAFCEQVCLICQKYVRDNSVTITGLLENESKRHGKPMTIQSFVRWNVGG